MKTFLTPTDSFPPFKVKVHSKYSGDNYDDLDIKAEKRGFKPVEPSADEKINTSGFVGLQNNSLHSGWIATMSDSRHKQNDQIEALKQKLKVCVEKGEKVIVGFCQTGHFSIGYTIYVKNQQ